MVEAKEERLMYSLGLRCPLFLKGAGRKKPPFKKEFAPCQGKNSAFPEIM
jgi:hypothetical protein